MAHRISRYGWRPDLPDQRDYQFTVSRPVPLPRLVDLRPQCPPVYDQGQLGSCTANAIAGAIQFAREKEKLSPDFVPSRLMIYYDERVLENTVASDAGAMLQDGLKTVATLGACDEALWPYDVSQFAVKPSDANYQAASANVVNEYLRVSQNVRAMRACLAAGFPFCFGFTVYESFESSAVAMSGLVPMPGHGESVIGGHAVLAVGYDDNSKRFIVRNSWGSGWGQAGYFTMDYAYLVNPSLASDFWTIRVV